MDYDCDFTFDGLSLFKIDVHRIKHLFITYIHILHVKNYKGLVYSFHTTQVLPLVDVAIHAERQTAWTSLTSHFSVCFLPFDAAQIGMGETNC